MNIVIDGIDVSEYIQSAGFSEGFEKVYDTSNSFTAADGSEYKFCKGIRKTYGISLYGVSVNTKNMLKARSGKTSFTASIDGIEGRYFLDGFSASVIIQGSGVNLWQIKFSLVSAVLDTSGISEEELKNFGVRIYLNDEQYIDLTTLNGAIEGDIHISAKANGLPSSGVCGLQLTFTVNKFRGGYTEPPTNAECYVTGFTAPAFHIISRKHSNDTVTFTCADRTAYLDLPFDSVMFETIAEQRKRADPTDPEAELFDTGTVIGEAAVQAGFAGFSGFRVDNTVMPKIRLSDITNKTCRNILDTVSASACGIFCCNMLYLEFIPLGDYTGFLPIPIYPSDRTDVIVGTPKGPIEGIYGLNNDSDENGKYTEYIAGAVFDPYRTIKITSKYVNYGLVYALERQCGGFVFRGFKVDRCRFDILPSIGMPVYFEDDPALDPDDRYTVGGFDVYLSSTGSYASLYADSVSESEWDFTGATSRQIEQRIEEGRKYLGVSLTAKNGLTCDTKGKDKNGNEVKGKVSLNSKEGLKCEGFAGKVTMENGTIWFYDNIDDEESGEEDEV